MSPTSMMNGLLGNFRPQVISNKIYFTWSEYQPSFKEMKVFVGVLDFSSSSPKWKKLHQSDLDTINSAPVTFRNMPLVAEFNGTIYLAYSQAEKNDKIQQLMVAQFNGDEASPDWTIIDSPVNTNTHRPNGIPNQFAKIGGKLMLSWSTTFINNNSLELSNQVATFVDVNGTPTWITLTGQGNGSIDQPPSRSGVTNGTARLVEYQGELYSSSSEFDNTLSTATPGVIRLNKFNGNILNPSWEPVTTSGEINFNRDKNNYSVGPVPLENGNELILSWIEGPAMYGRLGDQLTIATLKL